MKAGRGWFKNALLALLLVVLAVVAFRSLFPELVRGWGHGTGYDHHGGGRHDGYDHGKWWRHRVAGKGPWKGMLACPEEHRWIETRLDMGRDVDRDKLGIGEADWRDFLDTEIRTRLPEGFSVSDVYGFSAEDNPGHQEWTKVLILLHDNSEGKRAALDGIANAFLERFTQNSVLRSDSVACTEFLSKGFLSKR